VPRMLAITHPRPLEAATVERSQTARLVAVALLGAAIGWVTYELVFWLYPLRRLRAPASWMLAFVVGVARQHALHRRLTFRSDAAYWPSLARAYRYYGVVALVGGALDAALTTAGVPHRVAWLLCLAVTAAAGVLFLERHVFAGIEACAHE
jgi:putative flippase GtrA